MQVSAEGGLWRTEVLNAPWVLFASNYLLPLRLNSRKQPFQTVQRRFPFRIQNLPHIFHTIRDIADGLRQDRARCVRMAAPLELRRRLERLAISAPETRKYQVA